MNHPSDRLLAANEHRGSPSCVGIDPVLDRLPDECRRSASGAVPAIEAFCKGVLEAISGTVPVCKFQSACFERHGPDGVRLLDRLCAFARERGIEVILDFKRGDIGISAKHYAASALERADWVTVNPYLGVDGITPFVGEVGEPTGLGAFALVRTSNPGGDAIQSLQLTDGRTVADAVADLIAHMGEGSMGASGYSALGAVVGATKSEDAARLRARMPAQLFLVPGFGAQGGGVDDVLACFNSDGRGALVTASRSVIYAFEGTSTGWQHAIETAATDFARTLSQGLGVS
ncbi:MAG: orotidine-5'-phosphate decarboxylase [Planctomycetota bacterium]|nr:orotidine-5'-phosphate decarboxylase [Planctomycetota bacterium]